MSFTRRGRTLLGVVAFSLLMAFMYGPRSLNAVVVPGIVALAIATLYVRWIDQPDLDRIPPEDDHEGVRRTVRLEVETDSSFTGRLRDRVGEGLAAEGNDRTTTVESGTITYEVDYERRGAHTLGPASIGVRDVLGLAERTYAYHNQHEVLVYPRVHDLTGRGRHELNLLPEAHRSAMREEFENLREYERGDALRDVHWKTSAKQPETELMIKEYTAEDDLGVITLAAEAAGGRPAADAMAEAAASVATFLLASGLTVEVSAPEGVLEAGDGRVQRRRVLELFARTGPGTIPESERGDADVVVSAARDGSVTIRVDDRELSFDRLVGQSKAPPTDGHGPTDGRATPAEGGATRAEPRAAVESTGGGHDR